jgi:predicted ATPase
MSQAGHAQFIIASHSPILLACPDALIYSLDQAPLARVLYQDTPYYRIYKDFLNNTDKYLSEL